MKNSAARVRVPIRRTGAVAATCLGALAALAALGGCTDTFQVTAPYDWVWERSTETLTANGFEMVTVPDEKRLLPASDKAAGRAWFVGSAPDVSGWKPPRIIEITIEPVAPPEEAKRTITVMVENRDWVVHSNVPDPEMRDRVTWMLRQALAAPGTAPQVDERH